MSDSMPEKIWAETKSGVTLGFGGGVYHLHPDALRSATEYIRADAWNKRQEPTELEATREVLRELMEVAKSTCRTSSAYVFIKYLRAAIEKAAEVLK